MRIQDERAIPVTGVGGGGEPEDYLKSITKDESTQTITIKDNKDVETSFPCGGGSVLYKHSVVAHELEEPSRTYDIIIVNNSDDEIDSVEKLNNAVSNGLKATLDGYLIIYTDENVVKYLDGSGQAVQKTVSDEDMEDIITDY